MSCTFNVTVAPPPRLEKTRTLAFGDSITFGSSALCAGAVASQRWTPAELLSPWSNPVPSPTAYPGLLQTMLRDRYTAQQPIVVNAGLPGEAGNDSETRRRFTRTLNENAPEVLLLQEGINDLHSFGFYAIPTTQGIARLVDALRGMALDARGRGIRVFLATLLPQRPNGCRAYAIPPRGDEDLITPTNNLIRSMASAENIDLIDLATLFQPRLETLIGPDGLHPTDGRLHSHRERVLRSHASEPGSGAISGRKPHSESPIGRHQPRPDGEGDVQAEHGRRKRVQVRQTERDGCDRPPRRRDGRVRQIPRCRVEERRQEGDEESGGAGAGIGW